MVNRSIATRCANVVAVWLALAIAGCGHSVSLPNSPPITTGNTAAIDSVTGARFERRGIMSQSDYVHMRSIDDQSIDPKGSISDTDLDFLIQLAGKPSSNPSWLHLNVAAAFASLTRLAPGQQDRIIATALPWIRSDNKYDQLAGLAVLIHRADRRGVSFAIPLVHSPDPRVVKQAKRYLVMMGYRSST
jgi:hypothetical protein